MFCMENGEGLANPASGDVWELGFGDGAVVGFALGTDEGITDGAFPEGTHAFTGVATVRLAGGVLGEDGAFDTAEIVFVNPCLAGTENVVAVVKEEAVFVRVAKEVEADDGARGMGVDGVDRLASGADPDELDLAFARLLGDPAGEGFAVLASTGDVAGLEYDPSDAGVGAVGLSEFVNADGRGANEVSPKTVMAIRGWSVVFLF